MPTICDQQLAPPADSPETAEERYYRAVLLANDGELDEALPLLDRALVDRPDSPKVLYARASAWALKGNADAAVARPAPGDLRRPPGSLPGRQRPRLRDDPRRAGVHRHHRAHSQRSLTVPASRVSLTVLVLAAGQGKRLRSKTIKLLHPVAGRPMVAHVLDAAQALGPERLVTVVGHQADSVREALDGTPAPTSWCSESSCGTGHAVLQAARADRRAVGSTLLILNGDLPTLRPATLRKLMPRHRAAARR